MQAEARQQVMEHEKQPYEKPAMSAVRLFADHVLQGTTSCFDKDSCDANPMMSTLSA